MHILTDKRQMIDTLNFYDVNYVPHVRADRFLEVVANPGIDLKEDQKKYKNIAGFCNSSLSLRLIVDGDADVSWEETSSVLDPNRLAIRSLIWGGGFFAKHLDFTEVMHSLLGTMHPLEDLIVCSSMKHYDENHLLCNGEVEVKKGNFGVYEYCGFINSNKGLTVRESGKETKGKNIIEITNRHHVPWPVFELIWTKGIIGSVIEFSIYNTEVGIKNERLVVWEIRRGY